MKKLFNYLLFITLCFVFIGNINAAVLHKSSEVDQFDMIKKSSSGVQEDLYSDVIRKSDGTLIKSINSGLSTTNERDGSYIKAYGSNGTLLYSKYYNIDLSYNHDMVLSKDESMLYAAGYNISDGKYTFIRINSSTGVAVSPNITLDTDNFSYILSHNSVKIFVNNDNTFSIGVKDYTTIKFYRLNSNGTILFSKEITTSYEFNNFILTKDGGLITAYYNWNTKYLILNKYKADGNLEYTKKIPNLDNSGQYFGTPVILLNADDTSNDFILFTRSKINVMIYRYTIAGKLVFSKKSYNYGIFENNATIAGNRIIVLNPYFTSDTYMYIYSATTGNYIARYKAKENYEFATRIDKNSFAVVTRNATNFDASTGLIYFTYFGVKNLEVERTDLDSIKLTWESEGVSTRFNVYKVVNGKEVFLQEVVGNELIINDLVVGNTYKYIVKTTYKVGTETASKDTSNSVSVYIRPLTPIVSVGQRTVKSIEVKWNQVEGATGYKVYRATSKKGTYKLVKTTTDLNYIDNNVTISKTYYYKVKSYIKTTKTYDSYYSNIISSYSRVSAPAISANKLYYRYNKIIWDKVPYATGYKIYRSTTENGTYTSLGYTKKLYYYDKTSKTSTYYYKIKAYRTYSNTKKYSLSSNIVSTHKLTNNIEFVVNSNISKINAITIDKLDNVTKYYIYRATSKKGTYKKIKEISSTEFLTNSYEYSDKYKTSKKRYYYKIKIFYNNLSEYSGYKSVVTK